MWIWMKMKMAMRELIKLLRLFPGQEAVVKVKCMVLLECKWEITLIK
jgi:hypothetical protein